ncbi:hypothetical protein ARMSODRAFT_540080 [Armillaria solidipes]|uniref:Uncharacterized protein n=1 Tax=Armillaria solidipes TaxID=1076256 RepID=A0A2H3B8H2_9AGAR|nr:hypothetical protein ARMSODRAFT_540080 [Armillaria solidipes]
MRAIVRSCLLYLTPPDVKYCAACHDRVNSPKWAQNVRFRRGEHDITMETWLPAVSVHRHLSPLDWFRHDSAWRQGLPQNVIVNKPKMSRQCGHQFGVDFWKQRLALTAKIMYHRQYSRDTRTRGSGGGGQGKEDDSRSPECETSPKLRAFSYILEDHFAWAWYGIQFTELFEIQHDGRGEAAENGADRVCEALLRKKKNVIGDGRRGCMFERKDRLLVIREGQIHLFTDLFRSHSTQASFPVPFDCDSQVRSSQGERHQGHPGDANYYRQVQDSLKRHQQYSRQFISRMTLYIQLCLCLL